MSTKRWNKRALKARLRADIAFDTAPRPVSADLASKRLEYFRIVALVEAGAVEPDAGAELFDALVASLLPDGSGAAADAGISDLEQQPAA